MRRNWLFGIMMLLNGALCRSAFGAEGQDGISLDYGGEFLAALAAPIGGDQGQATAGYRDKAPQLQQNLLLHGSADRIIGSELAVGLYANIRADEMRRNTPPEEPDDADFVKAAYFHLKHDRFGDLQIGHEADVRVQQGYWAPQLCDCLNGFLGTNSSQLTFNASPAGNNSTTADLDGRSTKIAWYGPEIAGVSLSLSYAPERPRAYLINPATAALGHRYNVELSRFASIAVDWQGMVSQTSIGIGSGLTTAHRDGGPNLVAGRNDADPLVWDAGFLASYAAWKVGAAFEQQEGVNAAGFYGAAAFILVPGSSNRFMPPQSNAVLNRTLDIGFTYSIGPVTTGVAWSRGLYEGLADPTDIKRVSINDTVFAGATYRWRDGLNLIFGLQDNNYAPNALYKSITPAAALNRLFGGADPGLNIWGRPYQAVEIITGVSIGL